MLGLFGGHDKSCDRSGKCEERKILQKVGYAGVICEKPEYVVVAKNIYADRKRYKGTEDNTVIMEVWENKDWRQYGKYKAKNAQKGTYYER